MTSIEQVTNDPLFWLAGTLAVSLAFLLWTM